MRVNIGDVRLFVDIDGFSLRQESDAIDAIPTLILLHGGPGYDHLSQRRIASDLSEFSQVVCYDHRGHGRSDRGASSTWCLQQWADDIVSLCDVLGIEKPVVMGTSFGGMVAQTYAIRHPDHPAKLILHSTAPRLSIERSLNVFERKGGSKARDVARDLWVDPGDPDRLASYTEFCMPYYHHGQSKQDIWSNNTIINKAVLSHFYAPGGEGRRLDLREQLSDVRCPVLILAGEEDPITPIEDALDLRDSLTAAPVTFRPFADCGHGVHFDKKEEFLVVVRNFVEADDTKSINRL